MDYQMKKEMLGMFIAIIAMVMGMSIPLLAIFLDYRKRKEMFTMHHKERMAAIEKGIELPPLPEGFFTTDGKPLQDRSPHGKLFGGLVLSFIGIGLTAGLYYESRAETMYGLIPLGIGVACLIYYFLVGKKEAEALEAERKAKSAEASRLSTPR